MNAVIRPRDFVHVSGPEAEGLYDTLWRHHEAREWSWWTADYDLNVMGFRGPDSTLGTWLDVWCIAYAVRAQPFVFVALATTDPGREGTATRSDGIAVWPEGYHPKVWTIGEHKGTPALVQRRPLTVGRDAVVDGVIVGAGESAAWGMNAHAPWRDGLAAVGDASHGCQVPYSRAAHDVTMGLAERQRKAGHGDTFSYGLSTDPVTYGRLMGVLAVP